MSEYGNGISFEEVCMLEKERIKHALNGELVFGEDANGFLYRSAGEVECAQFILRAYDALVYTSLNAMASARALERLENEGKDLDEHERFMLFIRLNEEERRKHTTYKYESDLAMMDEF